MTRTHGRPFASVDLSPEEAELIRRAVALYRRTIGSVGALAKVAASVEWRLTHAKVVVQP